MNRVLLSASEVGVDGRAVLRDRRAAHLTHTLRVVPGARVRAGVIDAARGWATVLAVSPEAVTLECRFDAEAEGAPPARVDLIVALPRPKAMKRLWAPLAMLGVGRIDVVNAEKVERNYFDTHWLDPAAYRPLLIEGLEQAGETRLPEVAVHRRLRPFVEDEVPALYAQHTRWVGEPGPSLRAPAWEPGVERAVLAVGPEGGWTAFELELWRAAGFRPISLGPRTLRTDVACISLLTLVLAGQGGQPAEPCPAEARRPRGKGRRA